MSLDGVLVIDKPAGVVSMRVVERVRRATRQKRAGHTGTLDPAATGVLPVCLGRATRIASLVHGEDKEYLATVRLGIVTVTGDLDGEVVREGAPPAELSPTSLAGPLGALRGTIEQRPPSYSAIRVDGVRLYDRARRGEAVEAPVRTVVVHEIELLGVRGADVDLRVRCGAGTYVRSLAVSLGEALGCGAALSALRRTRVGVLGLDRAVTLEEVAARAAQGSLEEVLVPPGEALAHLPAVRLADDEVRAVATGKAIAAGGGRGAAWVDGATVRLLDDAGRLVALAEAGGGALQPRKVFV
jgi:tRNA pseudouridine55 synthase